MIPVKDTAPCYHTPWMTWGIIVVCVAIFLFIQLLPEDQQHWIMYQYGMVPIRYSHPDIAIQFGLHPDHYFSALSGIFIHDGWLHILINVCFLWIFADNVEDRMGHISFLLFYLLCGLFSMALQWYFMPIFTMPVLGASGAIAGVLAAYFFLYPMERVVIWIPLFFLPIFVNVPAIAFLGAWVIFQLYKASTSVVFNIAADVAWWAHLGGFIAGCVLHPFFLRAESLDDSHSDEPE